MGNYIKPINLSFLNLSGGTVTGDTYFTSNLSASTIISGSTDLYGIFVTTDDAEHLRVQNGSNTYTGGTNLFPTVNISAATLNSLNVSGTSSLGVLSATTIISGGTNLYSIFQTIGSDLNKTYVQPGANIITGGTVDNPTINLVSSPSVNNFTASGNTSLQTVSATTIVSGSTNLYDIFDVKGSEDITRVQPGSNISTGGTPNTPTVNLVSSPSVNNFTASGDTSLQTVSATTIVSGSTNLYDIFDVKGSEDITRVQPGSNISTGGTPNAPTVNLVSSPSVNNFTASGDTSLQTVSATTFIASTLIKTSVLTATTISADTINIAQYVDFKSGTTNPTSVAGRVYYDQNENALSYYPSTPNMDVTVNIGQESLIKVRNNTGTLIPNGAVCHVNGSNGDGVPTIELAFASGISNSDVSMATGIATHNIENGNIGFITRFGIVRDLTITGVTEGTYLYLSDTVPGEYIYSTDDLDISSRISRLGIVITTGTSIAKILVNINNEDSSISLSVKEQNVFAGDSVSTGLFEFSGLTRLSSTVFSVGLVKGWIVDNTTDPLKPEVTLIRYSGTTGTTTPHLNSADATYLLVNSASTLTMQSSYPTPQERRQNIYLGKVVHPNRTDILNINNQPDFSISPISILRDMFIPMRLINDGIIVSVNGANLNFNTSAGKLYGLGINWTVNNLNPDEVTITAKTIASFYYRTQTGGTTGAITSINPNYYDVNGVITPISSVGDGTARRSTNQRVYLYPTGVLNVQYGQQVYDTLALALAGQQTEIFTKCSNAVTTGILIGLLAVRRATTDLSNSSYAVFTPASMFGESVGGVNGISTTTLQQAYNNSTNPEITTNSTLDGVQFKGGTGNDDDKNIIIENNIGNETAWIKADGSASFSSISALTISAGTFYGDGSQLSGISTDNFYTTAATLSSSVITFDRTDTPSAYNVNLSGIAGLTNYLPLSGGVLSGNLDMSGNSIVLSNISGDIQSISNDNGNILVNSDAYGLRVLTSSGMYVHNGIHSRTSISIDNGYLTVASGVTINMASGTKSIFLTAATLTEFRYIQMPDKSGTIAVTSDLNNYLPITGGTVNGNVLITGNVTIMGTATTIDTETLKVKDNIVTLNSNQTGATAPLMVDSGIEVYRNSGTTVALIWSEANQRWEAGLTGTTKEVILEPVFTVHTGNTDIHQTIAQMDARYVNVTGDTMTGQLNTTALSATTLLASTMISGNTNLYDIFLVNVGNGLTRAGNEVKLGDTLYDANIYFNTENSNSFEVDINNSSYTKYDIYRFAQGGYNYDVYDDDVSLSINGYYKINGAIAQIRNYATIYTGANPNIGFEITTDAGFSVVDEIFARGIYYESDYSANYTDRTLIDKGYVNVNFVNTTGDTMAGDLVINAGLTANTIYATTFYGDGTALVNTNLSGLTNYIPVFNSTSGVTNSIIYQNSSAIGVNTLTPLATFDIHGTGVTTGDSVTFQVSNSAGTMSFSVGDNGNISATTLAAATERIITTTTGSSQLYNYLQTDSKYITDTTVLTDLVSTSKWIGKTYTGTTIGLAEGQEYVGIDYYYIYKDGAVTRYATANENQAVYTGATTVANSDEIIMTNSTTAFTLMLVHPSACTKNSIVIKNINTGIVTLSATTLIDGASIQILTYMDSYDLYHNYSTYFIK